MEGKNRKTKTFTANGRNSEDWIGILNAHAAI